jgi:hypothetical protein
MPLPVFECRSVPGLIGFASPPEAVASGGEPFLVIGAIAGG